MNYKLNSLFLVMILSMLPQPAPAQQGPDALFRPVKSSDLFTKLPPRLDRKSTLNPDLNNNFLSFEGGGCPEEILIGSVDEGSDISGNIDIEVLIDGGIYIECGL